MAFAYRLGTVLMLCIISVFIARAQNDDCELTLNRASEEFNAGHFYAIPSVLSPCLQQFSKEQRQRAYLLLVQTYLLLDDPIGAKQSYLSILKANPEFQTDTAVHPIDVIYLSKKFTATSIFSWFARMGTNVTIPRMIHDLNPFGETGASEKYLLRLGYHVGIGGDLNVNDKINLRAEIGYALAAFKHESNNYWEEDSKEVIERQNWVSIPFTVQYNDTRGKYRPYGFVGYSVHYLLGAKSTITLYNSKPVANSSTEEIVRALKESPNFDILYMRNRLNHSAVLGGGLKVKVGLDFVFVDVRYNMGLKNVTSEKNLYGDNDEAATSAKIIGTYDPSMGWGDVSDLFRIDNVSLSIGFLRPLYKPRELKRAHTKSVMKQMRK